MNRRQVLAGVGTVGAVALAGCTGALPGGDGGRPELEWEYEYYGYLRSRGYGLVILGDLENKGEATAEWVDLTATLEDGSGDVIDSKTDRMREIAPDVEREFHFRFSLSDGENERLEEATVTIGGSSYPTPSA